MYISLNTPHPHRLQMFVFNHKFLLTVLLFSLYDYFTCSRLKLLYVPNISPSISLSLYTLYSLLYSTASQPKITLLHNISSRISLYSLHFTVYSQPANNQLATQHQPQHQPLHSTVYTASQPTITLLHNISSSISLYDYSQPLITFLHKISPSISLYIFL